METINVRKLSAGTVYKLIAIGLATGFLPLFIMFGILASTGMEVLTWNDQQVVGLKALIVAPLMGGFMALIFTALIGSIVVLGLWLYSFVKPVTIEYTPDDSAESVNH